MTYNEPNDGPHPYNPQQLPGQPHGAIYGAQQPAYVPPPPHAAPVKSQAVAVIAAVIAVVGLAMAVLAATRGVAALVAIAAAIIAIVALATKQGGKGVAITALAVAAATIPLIMMFNAMVAAKEHANERDVQQIADCLTKNPEAVLKCSGVK